MNTMNHHTPSCTLSMCINEINYMQRGRLEPSSIDLITQLNELTLRVNFPNIRFYYRLSEVQRINVDDQKQEFTVITRRGARTFYGPNVNLPLIHFFETVLLRGKEGVLSSRTKPLALLHGTSANPYVI